MKPRLINTTQLERIMSPDSVRNILQAAVDLIRSYRGGFYPHRRTVPYLAPDTRLDWRDIVAMASPSFIAPLGAELAGEMLEDKREVKTALLELRLDARLRCHVILVDPQPELVVAYEPTSR